MLDLQTRKDRIGGSEVAAIFGDDDFGRDGFSVWYDKKGDKGTGPPEPPSIRMVMGQKLERGILDLYSHITGKKIEYHNRTIAHPRRRYMAATPDALCLMERRGVDAKLVFWDQRKHWGPTANEIPHRVVMQAWWYMAAFDYDYWDICALIGTGEPAVYTIERDLEVERAMLARVEEWHARYILGNEIPPLGRTPEAAQWLARLYPDDNRPNMREADEAEIAVLTEYVNVRVAEKELEGRRAELETQLKAAIRDHEGLEWPEGKFTWRKTKDGHKTDWESMSLGLLHEFIKDEPAREERINFYTRPIPGYRKIRLDHPAVRKGAHQKEEVAA